MIKLKIFFFLTFQFLSFTKSKGNDLSSPHLPHFPGLKPGDRWALCSARWLEAFRANKAPLVKIKATNFKALDVVKLSQLEAFDDTKFGYQS